MSSERDLSFSTIYPAAIHGILKGTSSCTTHYCRSRTMNNCPHQELPTPSCGICDLAHADHRTFRQLLSPNNITFQNTKTSLATTGNPQSSPGRITLINDGTAPLTQITVKRLP